VYLDDSSVENGCTWVVPASHRSGKWRTRHDADEFGNNEIDQSAYPDTKPIPVEVPAGSTVSFGAFLVHMSTPNPSDKDRRALLYSYQPAGRPHMLEGLRRLAAEVEARGAAGRVVVDLHVEKRHGPGPSVRSPAAVKWYRSGSKDR